MTEVTELQKNFDQFTAELSAELAQQKTAIESISFALDSNYSAPEFSEDALGLKSFLKSGEILETKSYNSSSYGDGGFTISPKIQNAVNSAIADVSIIRKLAKIEQISTSSLEIVQNLGGLEAGWTMEIEQRNESKTTGFTKKIIHVHELYAQPKASQRFLDDSFVNVESWLRDEIASSFAALESKAFISGEGTKMPKGILSVENGNNCIKLSEDLTTDNLLDLIYLLPSQYHKNAAFIMHPETVCLIRKLKEENSGRFLWNPSLETGKPSSILGIAVYEEKHMPKPGQKGPHIAIADFKQAYKVVDRAGLHMLRDPFTDKPFVKFYITKRVGGDVVNEDAIMFMSLKAAK